MTTTRAPSIYRPSLDRALELLRDAERLQPATTVGYAQLLAARCEMQNFIEAERAAAPSVTDANVLRNALAAEQDRGDRLQRQVEEQKHLAGLARMFAQRGLQLIATEWAALPAPVREPLKPVATAVAEIDRLLRTGVCSCPPGACDFKVPEQKAPPLRRSVGPFVKLRAVPDDSEPFACPQHAGDAGFES